MSLEYEPAPEPLHIYVCHIRSTAVVRDSALQVAAIRVAYAGRSDNRAARIAQDSRVLLRNLILRESDSKAVTRLPTETRLGVLKPCCCRV